MHLFSLHTGRASALLLALALPVFAQKTPVQEQINKKVADACRQLAITGTRESVALLAALLSDEEHSHMARYALETIADPAVDAALREALDQLKGRPLVGVIGSLGVRRDARAVEALAKKLKDSDDLVAVAAARALGKIGTPQSIQALLAALPETADTRQLAFCEGLLRGAEALAGQGGRELSVAIYDRLAALGEAPHQVRTAAVRGAILARQREGVALLRKQLRNEDYLLFAAAVRTSLELPGAEVTRALTAEVANLSADRQILVIWALGRRGEAGGVATLANLAKTGEKAVRLAAIRTLPEIGNAAALKSLAGLLADSDREIAQAAQEGLASLTIPEADAAVEKMFDSQDVQARLTAIDLMGRRRMASAVPALLEAATGAEAQVRPAALRKLGELGTPAKLDSVLDLAGRLREPADLDALEQAINDICAKAAKPESCADPVISRIRQSATAQKSLLLRVLGSLGGATALKTVREAAADANADLHATAIRVLGAWKTADAAPDLLQFAKNAASDSDKTLCLRAFLGMAANPDLPADQRLAMCRQAVDMAQATDQKKLLLGALGGIPKLESLALIIPCLDNAETKEEASTAIVSVANPLVQGKVTTEAGAKLVEALEKAGQATANEDLAKRTRNLATQARNKAGK